MLIVFMFRQHCQWEKNKAFLLLLNDAGSLSEEEFLLLYNMKKSILALPYWNYPKFDLDSLENEECVSGFWFEKKDVYILGETLETPESIICYNETKVDGIESLCISLKRFAYPCRYLDMISRFGRPCQKFVFSVIMS